MAAAGAQGRLAAAVVNNGKSDTIGFRRRRSCVVAIYLPSMLMISSVTERASIGSP